MDELRDQITRELVTYMMSDPLDDRQSTGTDIDRQGSGEDRRLATNIAEDVIFMVQGKTVKHKW